MTFIPFQWTTFDFSSLPLATVHPLPLTFAVILALYLAVHWKAHGKIWLLLALITLLLLALFGIGLIPIPEFATLLENIGTTLGSWTYLLVGALAYLETGAFVGLIAPGETAVIVGGVVAGQGKIDLITLIGLVWFCAVAGDVTSFFLGRKHGRSFLLRYGRPLRINERNLGVVEEYFERRGVATIFIGRFIGLVRPLLPFVAGSSGMSVRRFLPIDVLGAGLWSTIFCLLGFVFWHSFQQLVAYVGQGLLILGAIVSVVVAIVAIRRLKRDPAARARLNAWLSTEAQRPLIKPFVSIGRRFWHSLGEPLWNKIVLPATRRTERIRGFISGRLTPGELGLELTALLAVIAVGSFVFIWLGILIQGDGMLRIDTAAFTVGDALYLPTAIDVVKIFTTLGSLPVVAVVVSSIVIWLCFHRRWYEGGFLVAGLALTILVNQVAKHEFARPRPANPYLNESGFSFPSGHSAYAVAFLACAIVLTARKNTSAPAGFGMIFTAIIIVVAIALSRVYLRVHYLSDTIAGVALGLTIFAICGSIIVLIGFFRNNSSANR